MAREVLRLENISKSFGHVQAVRNVSLSVFAGEVVALLGDNGAGKSTLIKAISGVYPPSDGRIYIDGNPATVRRPRDAMQHGIETIHQDSSLALDLSIARNLFLGREPSRVSWLGVLAPINREELRSQASALLKRVGISKKLDADTQIRMLSGGERQSISISRAMHFFAKIIILDEPTNNLGVEETNGVLRFIREVKQAGHSVIYITHNIPHVFQVADRAIIMRQGEVVADVNIAESDVLTVESIITGADMKHMAQERPAAGA